MNIAIATSKNTRGKKGSTKPENRDSGSMPPEALGIPLPPYSPYTVIQCFCFMHIQNLSFVDYGDFTDFGPVFNVIKNSDPVVKTNRANRAMVSVNVAINRINKIMFFGSRL